MIADIALAMARILPPIQRGDNYRCVVLVGYAALVSIFCS
jgi:hypothetical protein